MLGLHRMVFLAVWGLYSTDELMALALIFKEEWPDITIDACGAGGGRKGTHG